tara:strand:+ start:138 stop:332 length:195 start_codon:yes stop_codon:yes gene_type:complete
MKIDKLKKIKEDKIIFYPVSKTDIKNIDVYNEFTIEDALSRTEIIATKLQEALSSADKSFGLEK